MLRITREALAGIVAHARDDAPIEACGYLGAREGVAARALRLTNADASPEHFSLLPREQFSAVRALREMGLALRAVYHSHPASPARMSAEDIRLAVDPALSYVIVSLAGPEPVVKSFTVASGVAEEPIEIAEVP